MTTVCPIAIHPRGRLRPTNAAITTTTEHHGALARGKQVLKDNAGKETVSDFVVAWTNTYNEKTRVFATTLGHNNETVADPRYLDLVTRGLLWSTDKLDDEGKPKAGYGPGREVKERR